MKRAVSVPLLFGLCLHSFGCAGGSSNSQGAATSGLEGLEGDKPPAEAPPAPPEDVVERAARPFSGYRPADGRTFTDEELITFLAAADAVCVGERHDQVLDHYAELRLLQGLGARREFRGFELGLAMEMVRISEQPTLIAYEEGKIDDAEFEDLSLWKTEWGYPIQYYRPQMRFAAESGVPLMGLGVDREVTQEVAESGLDSLTDEQARTLPEIDAENVEHRALFDSLMEGHPMKGDDADQYYAAQLIWDEKMAEVSADWLKARAPGRKLLIFAGTAHCHKSAIPSRIARRTGFTVVSVLPVAGGGARSISDAPESAEDRIVAGYDYQMVFSR